MTTAAAVPVTREEELEGDDAFETIRRTGRRRLVLDAVERFRAADGFSHSRALAFQVTLTLLPAIIAIVGLAAALEVESFTRVVRETIAQLAPGAVGGIFTDALQQGTSAARQESGETALAGGAIAAAIAGTTAMAQVERGANRIYGTEKDRPFFRKYLVAALLAATAGSLRPPVGCDPGRRFGDPRQRRLGGNGRRRLGRCALAGGRRAGHHVDRTAVRARASPSPARGLMACVRRRAPSALLWLCFMAVLVVYVEATGNFGATYGPIAGTIGVLLWTFLSAVALFLGLAFAAPARGRPRRVPRPARSTATRTSDPRALPG
jgi:uncharacterized BrkB/YihY/UPF0761 family membrane protein